MALYEGAMEFLKNIGFLDVILPWLLVYAITYGILVRTNIFGRAYKVGNENVSDEELKTTRGIISLISLSVATISVFSINFVRNIKDFIPLFVTFLIVVFTLIMVVASFVLPYPSELSKEWKNKLKYMGILSVIIFVILVINFFGLLDSIYNLTGGISRSTRYVDWISIVTGLGMLLFIGAVMYWLYKEPGEATKGSNGGNGGS